MAFLTVTHNMGGIIEAIELGVEGLSDLTPLWNKLIPRWASSRRKMFLSQGATTGRPWVDYTDQEKQYVAIKGSVLNKRITRKDLLRWEPGREQLFPGMAAPSHPMFVARVMPQSMTLGTSVPHAGNHDAGLGKAPKHLGGHSIPKRPLLRFGRFFQRAVAEETSKFAGDVTAAIEGSTEGILNLPIFGIDV